MLVVCKIRSTSQSAAGKAQSSKMQTCRHQCLQLTARCSLQIPFQVSPVPSQRSRRLRAQATHSSGPQDEQQARLSLAGAAAAAVLLASPYPAMADIIQTVPPSQVTEMARPLPKQTVNKGQVWTVCVGGAALIFVGTVAAENNEAWFPAITRANQAMKMSREAAEKAEREAKQQQQKR